jgi:hypothetical protein
MIIRIREYKGGDVVQCIRTTYDPALKRGKQQVVASFPQHSRPNDEQVSRLHPDERDQLDDWLKTKRKAEDVEKARDRPKVVMYSMETMVKCLNDDDLFKSMESGIDADAMYEMIDNLVKALRKRGIRKIGKPSTKPSPSDTPIEKMIKENPA